MRYFLDQEFIEGLHKPLFGKRRHFIDLISIGIVAEDGREYQAISSDYRYDTASDWVKENVIEPLYVATIPGNYRDLYSVRDFNKSHGKSNKQIAKEIYRFFNPTVGDVFDPLPVNAEYRRIHNTKMAGGKNGGPYYQAAQPELWGYFADYDHVLLCSLFGTMMDLPEGFPQYTRDLKQLLDETVKGRYKTGDNMPHFETSLEHFKKHPEYPKQENEHLAIYDARWNKKLYEFLDSYINQSANS